MALISQADRIRLWVQHVLKPLLDGQPVSQDSLERYGGLALLSADVDRIKDYVFESTKLPEIRGASMLLEELGQISNVNHPNVNQPSLRQLFVQTGLPVAPKKGLSSIIYAAGGSLLALVPLFLSSELQIQIEELYPCVTGTATITCVFQEVVNPLMLQINFRRLMGCQAMLLRRRKEQRVNVPFFEALPHQRRCTSCGVRPATTPEHRKTSSALLCSVCNQKVVYSVGKNGKQRWSREFERYVRNRSENNRHNYLKGLSTKDFVGGAEDVGEIASAGRNRNTIGFIYADGDRVGKFIEHSLSVADYRKKSHILTEVLRKCVYNALGKFLRVSQIKRDDNVVYIHPFEILTIGGDDLLLIVPGDVALQIALDICKSFASSFKDRIEQWPEQESKTLERMPTMSAGVVIAHEHNPMRYVRNLAEQLLKSAKKRVRQSNEGAIDFLVLKSQSMLRSELRDLRQDVYEFTPTNRNEHISLVGRPYLVSEMERLLDHARLLRDTNFPHSQLQGIRQVLRQAEQFGRAWPTLWYLRQQVRLPKLRYLIRHIEQEWKMFDPHKDTCSEPPWHFVQTREAKRYYATVWEDLYETRELLPKRENEPEDIQERIKLLREKIRYRANEEVADAD